MLNTNWRKTEGFIRSQTPLPFGSRCINILAVNTAETYKKGPPSVIIFVYSASSGIYSFNFTICIEIFQIVFSATPLIVFYDKILQR